MPVPTDLQAICDRSPVHRSMGLRIEATPGGVLVRAEFSAEATNGSDGLMVHGGLIATLLDAAATFALVAGTSSDWTTVDLRVDFLRPVAAGRVKATGELLNAGRTLGRARASVMGSDGSPTALAIGTFRRGPELVNPVGG